MGWATSEQEAFLSEYKTQFEEAQKAGSTILANSVVKEVFVKFAEKWGPEHWHFNSSKHAKGEIISDESALEKKKDDMETVCSI